MPGIGARRPAFCGQAASDKPCRVARCCLLFLLAVGCADAEPAGTQPIRRAEEFRSEHVAGRLEVAENLLKTRGFTPEGEEWRGFLVDQGSEVTEASLRGGSCYVVIATGSSSLQELNVRVFDSDGTQVARDGQAGPNAALRYCPPHGGAHYVAALATAGTGLFGVRRYVGPAGLAVRVDDLFRDR